MITSYWHVRFEAIYATSFLPTSVRSSTSLCSHAANGGGPAQASELGRRNHCLGVPSGHHFDGAELA
jgi:hypothetical protein